MKSIVQFINEALKDGKRQKITFFEFLTMFAEEIGQKTKIDSEESMEKFLKFIADNKKYGFEMEYVEDVYMYGQSGEHWTSTDDKDYKDGDDKIIELINEYFLDAKTADVTIKTNKKGTKEYWFTTDEDEIVFYVYK